MSTRKQMLTNRRNARKSIGPKTTAGKLTVSPNAVQHGWLARNPVLPHETSEEYVQLGKRIVNCVWRLSRGPQIEVGILFQKELATIDHCYLITKKRENQEAKFEAQAEASHPGALDPSGAYRDFMTVGRYEAIRGVFRPKEPSPAGQRSGAWSLPKRLSIAGLQSIPRPTLAFCETKPIVGNSDTVLSFGYDEEGRVKTFRCNRTKEALPWPV